MFQIFSNKKLKIQLKSTFQFGLSILAFLIIADILGLVLFTFFPVSDSTVLKVANFDLIVSILLIISLIFNKYIFKKDKFMDSAKNSVISLFAFIPIFFIEIYFSGIHPSVYVWLFWVACRIIHIFGLFYSLKFLGSKFIEYTKTNNLNYGIIATFGVFIICAIIFYLVESPINPAVGNFEDAIWYSLASITSTGYGDITPITSFGRLVGTIIIVAGVAFTSFATASVASTIINDMNEKREKSKDNLLNFYKDIDAKFLETQNQIKDLKKDIVKNQYDLNDSDLIKELNTKVSEN